jgi:MSHA pilin protein MshC
MRQKIGNTKGFTLIEVIAILVVLGILAVVVLSRGSATEAEKLRAEIDTLKAHIRYAQYLALNDMAPTRWGIAINGSSYTLVRNLNGDGSTFDNPHNLPNDSSYTHNLNPFTATSTNILFDEWGSPGNTDTVITLGSQTITIMAETGYIQ